MSGPALRACLRCGIAREVKPERGIPDLCIDCRLVERSTVDLCGTVKGYYEHYYAGQLACDACLAAKRERQAELRRAKGIRPQPVAKCGTNGGYFAHWRRKQPACGECLAAHAKYDYETGRRPRKRAA